MQKKKYAKHWGNITIKKVKNVINKLKIERHYKITVQTIKKMGTKCNEKLLKIINIIWKEGEFSKEYHIALIIPVYNEG